MSSSPTGSAPARCSTSCSWMPRSSTSASSPATTPCRRTRSTLLLVTLARDGKRVVRLKGGDPFVFGRGGEEVEFCREAGVDVEVVPGVTSAISVPAIAGIPLTHRGLATTFTVVTGHDQIVSLGGGRDHTVVLLMGVGTLAHSAHVLAAGDRGADCPVAIIEDGYGARQRVTVGTLDTIAAQAAARGIRSPAVIVVGDVVTLSPYAPQAIADARPAPATDETLLGAPAPKGHPAMTLPTLRVAIVGAGPAGIYAGNILRRQVAALGSGGGRRPRALHRPLRVAPRTVRPDPLRRRPRPPAHQGHRELAARDARLRRRAPDRQRRDRARHRGGRAARALRRRHLRDRSPARRAPQRAGRRAAGLVRLRRLRRLVRRAPRRAARVAARRPSRSR